jgi:hypothetical protein
MIQIFQVLFFTVSLLKGTVISRANEAYVTQLNNPGYVDVVKRPKSSDPRRQPQSQPVPSIHSNPIPAAAGGSTGSLPVDLGPGENPDDVAPLPIPAPSRDNSQLLYRVFTKFALRDTQAIGMFYFSQAQVWGVAAHVIYEALHGLVPWQPSMRREPFLRLPFGFYSTGYQNNMKEPPSTINGLLILAIDETRHEDMFWSAGMEFVSIVMGAFTDTVRLCSEYEDATDVNPVALYVFHVTRLILLASRNGAEGRYPGVVSMMRAIDLVRGKYPLDTSEFALAIMRQQGLAAVQSVMESTQG